MVFTVSYIIFLGCLCVSTENRPGAISQNITWFNAYSACLQNGTTLSSYNDSTCQHYNGGTNIWTDEYEIPSPWISKEGCYSLLNVTAVTRETLEQCYTSCSSENYPLVTFSYIKFKNKDIPVVIVGNIFNLSRDQKYLQQDDTQVRFCSCNPKVDKYIEEHLCNRNDQNNQPLNAWLYRIVSNVSFNVPESIYVECSYQNEAVTVYSGINQSLFFSEINVLQGQPTQWTKCEIKCNQKIHLNSGAKENICNTVGLSNANQNRCVILQRMRTQTSLKKDNIVTPNTLSKCKMIVCEGQKTTSVWMDCNKTASVLYCTQVSEKNENKTERSTFHISTVHLTSARPETFSSDSSTSNEDSKVTDREKPNTCAVSDAPSITTTERNGIFTNFIKNKYNDDIRENNSSQVGLISGLTVGCLFLIIVTAVVIFRLRGIGPFKTTYGSKHDMAIQNLNNLSPQYQDAAFNDSGVQKTASNSMYGLYSVECSRNIPGETYAVVFKKIEPKTLNQNNPDENEYDRLNDAHPVENHEHASNLYDSTIGCRDEADPTYNTSIH